MKVSEKTSGTRNRSGITLLELIIVIGIIALLLSLLSAAVIRVRIEAYRSQDKNSIRQILLALHNYASQFDGNLPGRNVDCITTNEFVFSNNSPQLNILPYLDTGLNAPYAIYIPNRGVERPTVKLYISPADPMLGGKTISQIDDMTAHGSPSCFADNSLVFDGRPNLTKTIPDGTSQTIGIGMHYYGCYFRENNFEYLYSDIARSQIRSTDFTGDRSGTFADARWADASPIFHKTPPTTRSNLPGTFQVRPDFDPTILSDGRYLQTAYASGLIVGMMDGSVKTLSPSISENTFWYQVTPNGGETIPD